MVLLHNLSVDWIVLWGIKWIICPTNHLLAFSTSLAKQKIKEKSSEEYIFAEIENISNKRKIKSLMGWNKRGKMSIDEPVRKRLCTNLNQDETVQKNEENLHSFLYEVQEKIEGCFPTKCLCGLQDEPLNRYINLSLSNISCDTERPEPDSCLLFLNFITWICQTFHDQLLSGQICSRIYQKALILVKHPNLDEAFFLLLRNSDENIQFSSVQAISSLLPLCHCGVDIPTSLSSTFLKGLLSEILDKSPAPASHSGSLLDCLAPGDEAALDDFDFESPPRSKPVVPTGPGGEEEEEEDSLRYRSLLLSILAGYVTHGSRQREEAASLPSNCSKTVLEEEMMCQEMQVKCLVIKMMDPVWPQFTSSVIRVLSSSRSSLHRQLYLVESFKLWQSLISVRANLSFLESRVFSADLPRCLPLLRPSTPATVWRSVLDTVSECLCYGTTLGLQSCPPQEPCSLAHSIIRWYRAVMSYYLLTVIRYLRQAGQIQQIPLPSPLQTIPGLRRWGWPRPWSDWGRIRQGTRPENGADYPEVCGSDHQGGQV